MSTSNRAPLSSKPCTKQMTPTAPRKESDSEFNLKCNSSLNLSEQVNSCVSNLNSSLSSPSTSPPKSSNVIKPQPNTEVNSSLFPVRRNSSGYVNPSDSLPSTRIRQALQKLHQPTWKVHLPNTAKSGPVQKNMADYFKKLATPSSTVQALPVMQKDTFLPAQRMFRLGAKIQKAKVHQSRPNPSSFSSPVSSRASSPAPLQVTSPMPYSYEDMSWRSHQSKTDESKSVNSILNRDYLSSGSTSQHKKKHFSSPSNTSSSLDAHSNDNVSIYKPSQTIHIESHRNAIQTRSRKKTNPNQGSTFDNVAPPSSSSHLSSDSQSTSSFLQYKPKPPEIILRECIRLHPQELPEPSISNPATICNKSTEELSLSQSSIPASTPIENHDVMGDINNDFKNFPSHSIPSRIRFLLKQIQSDSDLIRTLRDEYDNRQKDIQVCLEEILNSQYSQSSLSSCSPPLAQSIESSVSSQSSTENLRDVKYPQVTSSTAIKYDFSKLDFAGNASDNTFISNSFSSSEQSSSTSEISASSCNTIQPSSSPISLKSIDKKTVQNPNKSSQTSLSVLSHDSLLPFKQFSTSAPPSANSPTSPIHAKKPSNKMLPSSLESSSPDCDLSKAATEPADHSCPLPSQQAPSTIHLSHPGRDKNAPIVSPASSSLDPPTSKKPHSIRIIAQNCNGAFHSDSKSSEHYIPSMESLAGYSPDVICLSETNTDWTVKDMGYDATLTNRVLWNPSPSKTILTSCKWKNLRRTTYQPCGVMTLCLNSLPSRIKTVFRDEYGRYTKVVFQAKGDHFLSLYNVYRPNPGSAATSGVDTIWMQQFQRFREKNIECDPRDQCIKDLITDIQKDHENNIFPILVGDFNEGLSRDSGYGIRDLISSCCLKQIYEELHQNIPSSRLNHRKVFHIFVSARLVKYVERLGVLPAKSGFHQSDHIPFYVDFHKDLLLSRDSPIVNPSLRKLKMYDSPSVEKYICYTKAQMSHHNIIRGFLNLKDYINHYSFDSSARTELDLLDKQMTEIRLRSENRLRPDPSRFKNTTKMQLQVARIRHLKSLVKYMKLGLPLYKLIRNLNNVGLKQVDLSSQSTIEARIREEKHLLKFMQEEEDVMREDHLQALYEKAVEIQDKSKAQIIKNMKMREMQKRTWSKIRYATQDTSNRDVQRLGIPVGFENKSTKEIWDYLSDPHLKPDFTYINDPSEIERRLLEWQYHHYGQSKETPLASSQWHDKLDPNQLSDEEMDEIMQGKLFSDPDLPVEAKSFLSHMIRDIQPEMSASDITITPTIFRSFYRGTKESTSSSPSGLHLGHWKACAADADISMVLSGIIELAISNLHTLPRWQKVVAILMEKIHGSPYIHKFRTIHLLESDLNFVLRYVWGKMFMKHNETNQAWHSNQYGSRKGIQGQSATLNKVLTLDTIRYYALPAAIVDKDAQACYDRIIPVVLSYALIRLGLPKNLTRFMCKWLEQATYFIKTSKGISKHFYTSTIDTYLYGTGQGTGWSPPNWGAISDVISCAMEANTPGMYLLHPNRKIYSNRSYDSFVDDVNSGLTEDGMHAFHPRADSPVPLLSTIYDQLHANVQYYSRLLFTSGGKLALAKCQAYLLAFKWRNGCKEFIATEKIYPPLKIDQTCTNNPQTIGLLNPSVSRKMLGAYSSPDGQTSARYNVLLQISKKWGNRVSSSYLNRYDAITSFKCGLLPALQYPLGVSLLSEKQCDSLLVPAITPLLHKLGIISTVNREIVHGPYEHGGLQVPNLFTIQGIHKIKMFLGHMRKQDTSGKLLTIALGTVQQEVGISDPILTKSFSAYSFLVSHSWIKKLWRFLSTIEGSIKISDVWTPKPAYENDTNIMETVLTWDISSSLKKKINLCRLYFRVYFLGEILDSSGSRIKSSISSFRNNNFHQNKFPWIVPYARIRIRVN